MNSMTTNMSAPPIWGSEMASGVDHVPTATAAERAAAERAAALSAGWRAADLDWERLQEEANLCHRSGDTARAAKLWRRAGWIALWRFRGSDPRRATTLANLALADRLAGRPARARRRYAKARRIWGEVDSFIAAMQIARRARSSLFHLRMETKHWDTYQQNMRDRMAAFAEETAEALAALERAEPVSCRLYERWRGEKPAVFDDTRKLLAAALLVGAGEKIPTEIEDQ